MRDALELFAHLVANLGQNLALVENAADDLPFRMAENARAFLISRAKPFLRGRGADHHFDDVEMALHVLALADRAHAPARGALRSRRATEDWCCGSAAPPRDGGFARGTRAASARAPAAGNRALPKALPTAAGVARRLSVSGSVFQTPSLFAAITSDV